MTERKETTMYWDWTSLQEDIQCDRGHKSVLHKFPASVGREVACHVVKYIAQNLSIAAGTDEPSSLQDEKDVNWTMEVSCSCVFYNDQCFELFIKYCLMSCLFCPNVFYWKLCFAVSKFFMYAYVYFSQTVKQQIFEVFYFSI